MTTQINDILFYKNKELSIAAINSSQPLFSIEDYGIKPKSASSACWRGYMFEVFLNDSNQLILKNLIVNCGSDDLIKINHVLGVRIDNLSVKNHRYKIAGNTVFFDINLPLSFTGSLIGCDGFIRELYVHMGFHDPYKYETVIEFIFDQGACTSVNDLSKEAKLKREQFLNNKPNKILIEDGIEKAFSLNYDDKWDNK